MPQHLAFLLKIETLRRPLRGAAQGDRALGFVMNSYYSRKESLMRRIMVRYRLKPDRVQENRAYVQKVFADLQRSQPPGLRYASFVGGDGVSMFHIVSV